MRINNGSFPAGGYSQVPQFPQIPQIQPIFQTPINPIYPIMSLNKNFINKRQRLFHSQESKRR